MHVLCPSVLFKIQIILNCGNIWPQGAESGAVGLGYLWEELEMVHLGEGLLSARGRSGVFAGFLFFSFFFHIEH